MKNKLFNTLFAVIVMAMNSFAQTDADRKIVNKNVDDLFAEDCDSCDFPVSEKRAKIIKTLNEYISMAKLDLSPATEDNLRSYLDQSGAIKGADIKGVMLEYRKDPYGYGYKLKPYYPRSSDLFATFYDMPYMKVDGVKNTLVIKTNPAPKEAPALAQTTPAPKQQDPAPAKTQSVAATPSVTAGYYYNNVVNSYNNGSGHSCAGTGCTNPGCVDLAREVYPIGAFASQPRTYGTNYGGYGSGVSISVWWNGGYYYPYNGYYYCRSNGQRVCANDYLSLCTQFGPPESCNPNPNAYSANPNAYYGPHSNVNTGNSGSGGYVQPSSGGYHPSGQPVTYGVR